MMKLRCPARLLGWLLVVLLVPLTAQAGGDDKGRQRPNFPTEWTRIDAAPSRFLGRDLAPSCSALPGTDPSYHFWVKRGKVNRTVVYMEGGGACWNSLTCLGNPGAGINPTFVPFIGPSQDPRIVRGMFDLANEANPVRDWNFVYIPYCTGDVHAGSKDTAYPAGPGLNVTVRHRGFDNFLTVLKWMKENLHRPKQMLVTGSSAGGYGAIAALPWISETFPRARMSLLADASQGVTPPAWDTTRESAWNFQLAPWIFDGLPRNLDFPGVLERTMAYYPRTKFSQYTTAWDGVQVAFYGLQLLSVGTPLPAGQACRNWNAGMENGLAFSQSSANYRSYLASGATHTLLRSPLFYDEASAGVPFSDWLTDMLERRGGHRGHGGNDWDNVRCMGNCGQPAACVQ